MNLISLKALALVTMFNITVAGCSPAAQTPTLQPTMEITITTAISASKSTPLPSSTPTVAPTSTWIPAATFPGTRVVKDTAFQISIPPDWTRMESLPQGLDVGFRKQLAEGQYATFYFHYEVMPPEAGEPPSDTSDMKRQWDAMLGNQYHDVRSVPGEIPKVIGRILVNGTYELTDDGQIVRRQYTYFLSGKTAFVVQCSAPPTQWASVLTDFDTMLANLQPGDSSPEHQTISDESAKAELKRNLPTLFHSFPPPWTASLSDVAITSSSSEDMRTLEIALKFDRQDIGDIYEASRTVFGLIKAGKSDSDLNSLPAEIQRAASNSAEFIKYVGQVWGFAWGEVANCSPAVERYKLTILDSKGQRVGSISISREDLSAILTGKVTASDGQRLAGMYVFE